MFIQTSDTPNHNALKFLPNSLISNSPKHFDNIEEAKPHSMLATQLFEIEGVKAVFFGQDFITITKEEDKEWMLLKPEILMTIQNYIVSELPIFFSESTNKNVNEQKNLTEIEKQIIEIIDSRVRPAVAMDGGDIEFVSFEEGIVKLALKGACGGCPSSSITLKNGIESMLKHYIPTILSVEAVGNN